MSLSRYPQTARSSSFRDARRRRGGRQDSSSSSNSRWVNGIVRLPFEACLLTKSMVTDPSRIRLTARAAAPQDSTNARQELCRIERLRDVVVRAEGQPFQFFLPLNARGQNDDRNLSQRPQDRQQLESVMVWQREIENDQIRDRRARAIHCRRAIGGDVHVVTFRLEGCLEAQGAEWGRLPRRECDEPSSQHAGSAMTQRVPTPSALSTVNTPPWSAMTLLAIASPKPPPSAGANARLAMPSRSAASFSPRCRIHCPAPQ